MGMSPSFLAFKSLSGNVSIVASSNRIAIEVQGTVRPFQNVHAFDRIIFGTRSDDGRRIPDVRDRRFRALENAWNGKGTRVSWLRKTQREQNYKK